MNSGASFSLPIVDVSGLHGDSAEARHAVARVLRQACLDKGFFYCAGHGVSAALVSEVFEQVRQFFALPLADKMTCDKALSICNRGYEPIGNQRLQPGALPDLKEGFYIGRHLGLDAPEVRAGRFNHGPNVWPAGLPGFRRVMEAYFAEMLRLSRTLMRGLALSLDLDEGHFEHFCDRPIVLLRPLHYPPQLANAGALQLGAGAHTDFGGITVLLQDAVGGLQVRDPDSGVWLDAPPIADTFVINLGDMFARWTNDRYRSTLHRVINRSGEERYSVPFFLTGNPDEQVSALPGCVDDANPARYPVVTVEEHLRQMYQRTYG